MDDRKKAFENVKDVIRKYFHSAECGLYFTRNTVGDPMSTISKDKYFTVDICRYWSYLEVFGCTDEEKHELLKLYKELNDIIFNEEEEEDDL